MVGALRFVTLFMFFSLAFLLMCNYFFSALLRLPPLLPPLPPLEAEEELVLAESVEELLPEEEELA